jgi:hypothetical protein
LNSVNLLICVMVKCGVLFEVRTGYLNNIYTSFGFKGLNKLEGPILGGSHSYSTDEFHSSRPAETDLPSTVTESNQRCGTRAMISVVQRVAIVKRRAKTIQRKCSGKFHRKENCCSVAYTFYLSHAVPVLEQYRGHDGLLTLSLWTSACADAWQTLSAPPPPPRSNSPTCWITDVTASVDADMLRWVWDVIANRCDIRRVTRENHIEHLWLNLDNIVTY